MTEEIRPFRIEVPEADVDDLRERLRRTRWPDRETVPDWSQGAPLAWVQDLCQYGSLDTVVSRDDLLDNLMLYWLPGTAASSARLYWESFAQVSDWFTKEVTDTVDVPTGCTVFPHEVPHPSRRWAARRYMDIRHWGEPERGGHFAALEQPGTFVDEIRTFFRLVR
jgi:pimeloyl-ACP methyl ester carboxylesterase